MMMMMMMMTVRGQKIEKSRKKEVAGNGRRR
jgi:hypothetical protein